MKGNQSQAGGQTTVDVVYSLIKNNPAITRAEIARITGISPSYIQRCIETLKREKRIRRNGFPTFGGHWEIIDNGDL